MSTDVAGSPKGLLTSPTVLVGGLGALALAGFYFYFRKLSQEQAEQCKALSATVADLEKKLEAESTKSNLFRGRTIQILEKVQSNQGEFSEQLEKTLGDTFDVIGDPAKSLARDLERHGGPSLPHFFIPGEYAVVHARRRGQKKRSGRHVRFADEDSDEEPRRRRSRRGDESEDESEDERRPRRRSGRDRERSDRSDRQERADRQDRQDRTPQRPEASDPPRQQTRNNPRTRDLEGSEDEMERHN